MAARASLRPPVRPPLVAASRAGATFVLLAAGAVGALGACARPPRPAPDAPVRADTLLRAESGAAAVRARGVVATLGVPPFAVAGDSSLAPLGYALADLLTTDLARASRVRLVERGRLTEVLRELDLAAAGQVEPGSAPRVGQLVRADRLVVGAVTVPPGGRRGAAGDATLRLDVRLADVATGRVAGTVDATAPLADVLAAEKALALRLLDGMGIVLTAGERAAIEARPTRSLDALLAYGDGVRRQATGDYRGAYDAFRRAGALDPAFRAAFDRAGSARALSEAATSAPVLVPGLRTLDAAVGATVDRINRPLDWVTTLPRAGTTAADPAFPSTLATVIVTVTRP